MQLLFFGAVALNIYAALLVIARSSAFKTKLYRPMLWNIFLSILPAAILGVGSIVFGLLTLTLGHTVGIIALVLIGIIWLLMLPNASYLITELNFSHRQEDDPVPLWYDIILVITLAMSGVINTVINVFLMHLIFAAVINEEGTKAILLPAVVVAVILILVLVSFGMYLGRYLRLNSWDIKHPAAFYKRVTAHFSDKTNLRYSFGFTFTYAAFLGIIYLVVVGPIINSIFIIDSLR